MSDQRAVLLKFDKRRLFLRVVGFGLLCFVGFIAGVSTVRTGASGSFRLVLAWGGVVLGPLGVLAMIALVFSNVRQDYAVVEANGDQVSFVYPFGMKRLGRNQAVRCPRDGELTLTRLRDLSAGLVEFEISSGRESIRTKLGESSLEEDFEARFRERSERWVRSRA